MPAPFFTTNPAEFQRVEGLYINELDPPGFVQGVNVNHIGIFGQTVRGPLEPQLIASKDEFVQIYGGRDYGSGGAVVNEVWRALLNKPFGAITVVRAAAAAAVKASFTLETAAGGGGTAVVRLDASSVGLWGNDVLWKVSAATNGDANSWNLEVKYLGVITKYENLLTTAGNDNLAEVIGDNAARLIDAVKLADGRPVNSAPSVDGADADGFTNLGETVVGFTSVAGDNGTIASSDYIAALDKIKEYAGPNAVMCAHDGATITPTVNTSMVTAAAASSDRLFLLWSGDHTDTRADVITYAGTLNRNDRVVLCYNSPYTIDPSTGLEIQTPPHEWMASILSQTDVDIHPGEEATKEYTAGASKLTQPSLTREDYALLRAGGVSALERDTSGGFLFVSGVTLDLTAGKTEITRRRMADFLQLSVANRLKFFVKKKATVENRVQIKGEALAFLQGLRADGRIIASKADNDGDETIFVDFVTTAEQRAQGLEYLQMQVRLVGHMLFLVLTTEIGTGVVIAE